MAPLRLKLKEGKHSSQNNGIGDGSPILMIGIVLAMAALVAATAIVTYRKHVNQNTRRQDLLVTPSLV